MLFYKTSLLLLTLLTLQIAVAQNENEARSFFGPDHFLTDTLFIKTQFTECGEFGGHQEVSKIYLKEKSFYITYQNFSADCKTIKENYGRPVQILTKTITQVLTQSNIAAIQKYLHQLLDAALQEPFPMHAGYILQVEKSDKTINLFAYTWKGRIVNEYQQLIESLFDLPVLLP